jgi:hypothetical protein
VELVNVSSERDGRARFQGWHSGLTVGQRVTAFDGTARREATVDTYSQRHQIGWVTFSRPLLGTSLR